MLSDIVPGSSITPEAFKRSEDFTVSPTAESIQ